MSEKSFEEKMQRLDQIVKSMEGKTLPLEECVTLFKEGKELIADLEKTLKKAESAMSVEIETIE